MRAEASNTIKLAIPIIIGELAQMALHIIDTAMVGAISYKQLAAAALVINSMNIPFVLGIGMTISVSQMVSMAHGRRDAQLVSHYFFNGFILCTVTAVIISLSLVFGKNILLYLGTGPGCSRTRVALYATHGIFYYPDAVVYDIKTICRWA